MKHLCCTDVTANERQIVEAFADRAAIKQVLHDVKEFWGSGQQQVRNVWSNIGCWHLNLWLNTLVELWTWEKASHELTRCGDSPWDDPARHSSHADHRKALQVACLLAECSAGCTAGRPASGKNPRRLQTPAADRGVME